MPDEHPYRVSVVLDRSFGDRLLTLARNCPVWIVDSPENRIAARVCWSMNSERSHSVNVTLFKEFDETSSEDLLIGNLGIIDEHSGEYSAPIPSSILEIVGVSRTPRMEAALAEYGFNHLEDTKDGFRAIQACP